MNANNTAVQSGTEPKKTEVREILRSRKVSFVDPKTIKLPVAGTFPAVCFSVAMIGTYTSRFKSDNGDVKYQDYERIGFGFQYIDKNTGEVQEIFAEVALTDKRESRLHTYIMALHDDDQNVEWSAMVGKKSTVHVIHQERGGKMYASINAIEKLASGAKIGTEAKDKYIFFDFVSDYSVNGTDQMKMLPKKHLWFIENRSNEHGKNPFTQASYEAKKVELAAKAQANTDQNQENPPPQN